MNELSVRERESLEAVIRTGSLKAAAYDLGIAIQTLKDHMTRARRKLGVESTVQAAVKWATRNCDHV